jgi:hypothetical protein
LSGQSFDSADRKLGQAGMAEPDADDEAFGYL